MTNWTGRRTFVTGSTGFIGQHLVRRLTEAGARVSAAVFPGEQPERIARLPRQTKQIPLDVRNPADVHRVVEEAAADVTFHLAAVGVTDPQVAPLNALEINTGGTVRLLESLRTHGVERAVLLGTCHEYGARESIEGLDPFNFYAASKVAAWAFARAYWRAFGLPVVIARPFQVYGPGQPERTLIPSATNAALAGEDFPTTSGEQERDFIYVADLVDGILASAVAPGVDGKSVDLGTGQTHTVREVVEHIWRLTRASGRILTGALPYRPGVVMHLAADVDRTAHLIGWRAQVGLEEGLRRTIESFEFQEMNQPT